MGWVSCKCWWAHGGGTCPATILQVTLLAWGLDHRAPRGSFPPGRCGGRECQLLPWVHEQGRGQLGAGRAAGACPTAAGQGCRARHAQQLRHVSLKRSAVSCWLNPPGRKPVASLLPERGTAICPAPVSWCRGALLHPASLPWSLSHPGCVRWEGPSRLFLPSSFPGPIDRAVSAPRWAPPGPALLTQCSGSWGGFRGRGAQGWEKLRGGR